MSQDARCCETGTCILDSKGRCWCGQQWDSSKMGHAPTPQSEAADAADSVQPQGMPVPSS